MGFTPDMPLDTGGYTILDLPAELRNLIYEYALTEPSGLYYKEGVGLCASVATTEEANQLQYTCRVLRKETVGLGIRFNDISIHRTTTEERHVTVQAIDFLNACSPATHDRFKNVNLIDTANVGAGNQRSSANTLGPNCDVRRGATHGLLDFCVAHPQITINVYNDIFSYGCTSPLSFMAHGLMLKCAFREASTQYLLHVVSEYTASINKGYCGSRSFSEMNVRNFRIYPCGTFPEDRFRTDIQHYHTWRPALNLLGEHGGIDGWVEEIRRWFAEGI